VSLLTFKIAWANIVNAVKAEYGAYDELGEVEKNFVHHLKENGIEAMEDFLNPVKQYDGYLSMGKEDLVEANLKAVTDENGKPYYSEEEIAEKMIDYEDDAKGLKNEYDKVRQSVIGARNNAINGMSDLIAQDREARATQESASSYDVEATSNYVSSVDEFSGTKIGESGKAQINKMITSGEVENLMKDPKILAESLMYRKFGKAALDNVKKTAYEQGKNMSLAKQYNVPSINGGSPGGAGNVTGNEKSGTFGDWK